MIFPYLQRAACIKMKNKKANQPTTFVGWFVFLFSLRIVRGFRAYSPAVLRIYSLAITAYSYGFAFAGSCSASTTTQPS